MIAPRLNIFEKLIKPFLAIHPEERGKTFAMTAYFFLIITLIYILKPVQRALFIHEFGVEKLSWAYIGEGFFLIFVVSLYMKFAKSVSKGRFYSGILLFYSLNLIGFWICFKMQTPKLSALFYLWHAAFSITMTTVFWTLANDLYNTQEAKRLFGLILCGGSIGGICGGVMAKGLMQWMHSEDLLLLASGIVGMCLVLVWWISKTYLQTASHNSPDTQHQRVAEEEKKVGKIQALKIFFTSPYLLLLCGIVMMSKMSSTVVDNQFNAIISQHIMGKEALTEFFGGFFSSLNVLSFLMQLFATSLVLRLAGVGMALLLMPSGLMAFGLFNLFSPTFMAAISLRMFEGSVAVSVQQASKEMLYLPVSSDTRRCTKPLIDMLGYRMAKSFGGILLSLSALWFHLPANRSSLLVVLFAPAWIFMIWKIRGKYQKISKTNLAI